MQRASRGFTLIELLVVVAIIALLVAILLPALQEARELAKIAVCGSNLHHISISIVLYAGDNADVLPGYNMETWDDVPRPEVSNWVAWNQLHIGGDDSNDIFPGRRKLNPYVDNAREVFRCPSDVGHRLQAGETVYVDHGSSYVYNSNWYASGESHWVLYGKKISDFDNLWRQVSIADYDIMYTWPYWWWTDLGPHGSEFMWHDPPRKHPEAPIIDGIMFYNPKCNVGFLDGHASFIQLEPYEAGDYTLNRPTHIIDPTLPGPFVVP